MALYFIPFMKIHFWGTRGSLPSSMNGNTIRNKIFKALAAAQKFDLSSDQKINDFIDNQLPFSIHKTYGTNTPCVQIEISKTKQEFVFCDAGSGLRDFSHFYKQKNADNFNSTFHIFISHLHWDHIQGFPFFEPAYMPGNKVIIHGHHPGIEAVFKSQMSTPCFPVEFNDLAADISFNIQPLGQSFEFDSFSVKSLEQVHPGKSYSYRFEADDQAIVYATDSEHNEESLTTSAPYINFFENADALIFDAMYSLPEAIQFKASWGHSSNIMAVELAKRAQAKNLILFHHDPLSDDAVLDKFLQSTQKYADFINRDAPPPHYPHNISLAYDGLKLNLSKQQAPV